MFPTKEEFVKSCKEDEDDEIKFDFYCEHTTHYFTNNLLTDHTTESASEDEQDWVHEQRPEHLWKDMLECTMWSLIITMRDKVPLDIVKKYASEQDLAELKQLEEMKLVEDI